MFKITQRVDHFDYWCHSVRTFLLEIPKVQQAAHEMEILFLATQNTAKRTYISMQNNLLKADQKNETLPLLKYINAKKKKIQPF